LATIDGRRTCPSGIDVSRDQARDRVAFLATASASIRFSIPQPRGPTTDPLNFRVATLRREFGVEPSCTCFVTQTRRGIPRQGNLLDFPTNNDIHDSTSENSRRMISSHHTSVIARSHNQTCYNLATTLRFHFVSGTQSCLKKPTRSEPTSTCGISG